MAKLGINTGTTANDGTGDTLREAGGKINTNFDEIYSSLGDGTEIYSGIVTSIVGGDFISVSSPTGEVTITGFANTENINSRSLIVVGVSTLGVITSTESLGIGTIYTERVECSGAVIGNTLVGDGSQITGLATTERVVTNSLVVSGISTLGIVTGVTSLQATDVYATKLFGDGSHISNIPPGIATYASLSGLATDATYAGYATTAGISTYASNSGVATYAPLAGVSTYASLAGLATDATYAGYATTAGISTLSTHSVTAGISSYSGSWVLGADGTSNYTFTGNGLTGGETNPILYLVRGQVYRFTNQLGAHPFQIQETPNGSVGTAYTDGVTNNGVTNGDLIFNVQFDVPKQLYYQCTVHNSMGGGIEILNNDSDFAEYSDVAGIATYASTAGLSTHATYAGYSVISGFSTTSGVSTTSDYATLAGIATNATYSTYSPLSGIATYATSAGVATDATYATYSVTSGIATYATSTGIATYATSSGVSTLSTNSQGLTGVPDIEVGKVDSNQVDSNGLAVVGVSTLGIVTGATYYGDGSNLGGILPIRPVQIFQNLEVLGVTTLGILTSVQSLSSDDAYITNLVAGNVSGDGSGLTNVQAYGSIGLGVGGSYVGAGFTVINLEYVGEIDAEFTSIGNTSYITVTSYAATSNTQSDSLVVTGISTLGVVTDVTSIGVVDIYTNSITASEIYGNSDGADTVLAVTDTISPTGRRVAFIDDVNTGVSDYETVNVGNLIWVPDSGELTGVITYSGRDVGASGTITASTFIGEGSNITGVVTSIVAGVGVTVTGSVGAVTVSFTGITSDGNIETTGIVTAGSFVGDGSGLTNLPGISIENNTSSVGVAKTINFGDNLSVTGSGEVLTITGVGTFSGDYNDLSNAPTVPTNNNQLTNGAGFITTSFTSTSQLTNDVGFVTTGGTISLAEGITGEPDINVGIVSATTIVSDNYVGNGSQLIGGRWTLGANGSSDYTFTGVGFTETTNDPDIYLARGRIYEFVNEMNQHPFQIQDTPNGTVGNPYNNGIINNGVVNGTLVMQIPFNSPDTLYYQCTSHAGMGGTIFIYPTLR